MYRAVKAIKIAIGWDNFCSTRIKFRPVILLAFPLFLASCQKLDDGDAASSSLTDALRSETRTVQGTGQCPTHFSQATGETRCFRRTLTCPL